MEELERKWIFLLKATLLTAMTISSASVFSFAATSNNAHEKAGSNVVFLEKQAKSSYTLSTQHGLIAAKQNLSGSFNWGEASGACDRLEENGFNDWHLPNKDELNKLYIARTLIGGFIEDRYWSSTEYDQKSALSQQFLDGSQQLIPKEENLSVRPVRNF